MQTAVTENWNDIKKKIVLAVFFNRAVKRINDWCGTNQKPFESELIALDKLNNKKAENRLTRDEEAAFTETKKQAEEKLIACYPFANFLSKWNMQNSLLPFCNLLRCHRNFFSHGYHQHIIWREDELNALNSLYHKVAETKKTVAEEDIIKRSLFNSDKTLTFQGALFFVSLFLTAQDVNEMFDLLEQTTDIYFRSEKIAGNKTYKILNFYPVRDVYVFWAKRTNESLIPDSPETKRFYDIINYLRKCPDELKDEVNEELVTTYKLRGNDYFIHYAYNYLNDFGLFSRLVFEPHGKDAVSPVHDNNIDFSIYQSPQKNGTKIKGYMGKEVLKRVVIQLLNNTITAGDIETQLENFINTYHEKPLADINAATHPLPDKIKKRRAAVTDAEMELVLDADMVARLRWIVEKLENRNSNDIGKSAKADYITERWNRWNLYYAVKFPEEGITAFPQTQFVKIRALLTNYKKNKEGIINELTESRRYNAIVADIIEPANDLDSLYELTVNEDLQFCKFFLENSEERKDKYDGLALFLNLKNPFQGTPVTQFDSKVPMPVNKKLFEGNYTVQANHVIELIQEYYPVQTDTFSLITDKEEKRRQQEINKKFWKLKQDDEVLSTIAVKYLEKVLQKQIGSITVDTIALSNLDEALARLNLKLSFTIKHAKKDTETKKISFTFDEYKIAQNRMILHSLQQLAFLQKFNGKTEILFSEIEPELYEYLNSQLTCIKKILELESTVFTNNPALKNHPDTKSNGNYAHMKFGKFLHHIPDLEKQFTAFQSTALKAPADKYNTYYQTAIKYFRNDAMHTNVPIVNETISEEYFKPCIDFIEFYLKESNLK